MTTPIAHHGFLSDGRSSALVDPAGSIVWWCTPRFDSPPACDALLGGTMSIRVGFRGARVTGFAYERDTCVLLTRWEGEGLVAEVRDLMPWGGEGTRIVRIVDVIEGDGELDVGSSASYPLHASRDARRLRAGERIALQAGPDARSPLNEDDAARLLDDTRASWRSWAAQCTYEGPHRDLVVRSLLVLKGLTYRPTGAMVAAPTTSLPETLGGERNWDYRYAWLRDTGFCMDAFVGSGYDRDASRLAGWVLDTVAHAPGKELRVMYDIRGGPAPHESQLDLPGYAASRPVRVGNAAVEQFQLDAFGHVMDCLHLWQGYGEPRAREMWAHVVQLVERVREVWQEPDHGIWELPFEKRPLTYSKVMAWVALDRAIKAAQHHGLPAPLDAWRSTRDEMRGRILAQGIERATGAFSQSFDDDAADASNLRIPLVGFLPPDDPRVRATLDETRRRLMRDGLLLRYASDDGLRGREGAFLACSFWLVEALAMGGRRSEARALFDHLAGLAGPLGLYAEEFDPEQGIHLGNYPQAFTHAALVSAAWQLVEPSSTQARGEDEARDRSIATTKEDA